MNQPKLFFTYAFALSLIVAGALTASGQTDIKQIEPSYDLTLQLVVGSNDASRPGELPANLTAASKQLRSTFAFTNYRLANTLVGRVSNKGTFQYESTANIFGQDTDPHSQTFLDWSVANLRSMPNAKGQMGFEAQAFRFGARVPVVMGVKDEGGKMTPNIAFEPIGLKFDRVGLPENTPTMIGTLNLPGTGGTIFLFITIRSADM